MCSWGEGRFFCPICQANSIETGLVCVFWQPVLWSFCLAVFFKRMLTQYDENLLHCNRFPESSQFQCSGVTHKSGIKIHVQFTLWYHNTARKFVFTTHLWHMLQVIKAVFTNLWLKSKVVKGRIWFSSNVVHLWPVSKLLQSYFQMCIKGTFDDLCFTSKAWYLLTHIKVVSKIMLNVLQHLWFACQRQ